MSCQSSNFLFVAEAEEDDLSDWESPVDVDLAYQSVKRRKQSSWKKIRSFILWSPFIQVFKKHRYPWIQLAGHQGNFHAGEAGSVLKKLDTREQASFQKLMTDILKDYVPEYRGNVEKNGENYIQLQDLLCSFSHPCVMDVKMGVRTYLEEELQKARRSPSLRKDMYQKMIEIDSTAPTLEENEQKAVTKPRYMQWRDEMSSSVELGFRVEGIKKSDGNSSKDFKKIKTRDSIVDIMKSFVGVNDNIVTKYITRLKELMKTQETSEFFQSHEIVGSSLLFVHDADENVGVWMIDFGKSEPLPKGVNVDHRSLWQEGNHEDGYLFGLDNIICVLEEVQRSVASSSV
uniref:Kinase n=1 Tax=Arion vulgaris TaxID=1028688 RepID=A0A0B7ACH0_9EUPU